ncbi:MAG: SLC13 family permease [Alphaproteobacteria bacterium]|nr:SLC13 family permease [Alphaproteobacteria bacterium]
MLGTNSLRLLVALAAAGAFFAAPAELAPAAALTVFTVGLFATSALPESTTALLFFAIAVIAGIAAPQDVFAGFASGALWLVFGGIIIGAAVKETGLGKRMARLLLGRLRGGYTAILIGIVLATTALGFVMPSTMARTLLMVPIVLALADGLGLEQGRNARIGLVVAACLGSYFGPVGILPANVPNNVLIGAAETYHGIALGWLDYFVLHFPVLSLGRCALLILAIRLVFPDRVTSPGSEESSDADPGDDPGVSDRLSRPERRLGLILVLALAFWVTDSFHGIRPGWIALAAGIACILPGAGVLTGDVFKDKLALGPFFYVAGILGVGSLVVTSGLGDAVSAALLASAPIEPGAHALDFGILSAIATALGMVATMPGMPAILTPVMPEIATATGMPLETVLMTQVIGYATVVLPYQVPPIVVGLQIAGIRQGQAAKITLLMLPPTLLLIWPLAYGWWSLLGLFGPT